MYKLTSSPTQVVSKVAGPSNEFPQAEEAASVSAEEPSRVLFPVGAARGGAFPEGGVATDLQDEGTSLWFLPGKRGRSI